MNFRLLWPITFLWLCSPLWAGPITKVYLNGALTPVYFIDGDTFKVLDGPMTGLSARIAGFNTLESYGPVHQWGQWHAKELYFNAKMATLNARRGIWHCDSDMSKDIYGRILTQCPDLAKDQIKRGLAHVMSVTSEPGNLELIKVQQEAIQNQRGFWAHGVPDFILTSPHSIDEPGAEEPYNRYVSTKDGHSEKFVHNNRYQQCQQVCDIPSNLTKRSADNNSQTTAVASCMMYVGHQFRFGQQQADCLK